MAGWFVRAAFVLRLLLVSRNSGIVSCEGQRGDGAWGLPGGAAKRLSGSQQPSAAPADAAGKVSVLRYVPYLGDRGLYTLLRRRRASHCRGPGCRSALQTDTSLASKASLENRGSAARTGLKTELGAQKQKWSASA